MPSKALTLSRKVDECKPLAVGHLHAVSPPHSRLSTTGRGPSGADTARAGDGASAAADDGTDGLTGEYAVMCLDNAGVLLEREESLPATGRESPAVEEVGPST